MSLSKSKLSLSTWILYLSTPIWSMNSEYFEIYTKTNSIIKNKGIISAFAYTKEINNQDSYDICTFALYEEICQLISDQDIYKALEFIETYSHILKSKRSNEFFKKHLGEINMSKCENNSKYIYSLINDFVSKKKTIKIIRKLIQRPDVILKKEYHIETKRKTKLKNLLALNEIVNFLKAHKAYKSTGLARSIAISTKKSKTPKIRWASDPLVLETIHKKLKAVTPEMINLPIANEKRLIHYVASILPDMIPSLLKKNADPNLKDYKNLIPAHIIMFYLINKPHKKTYRPDCKNYMKIFEQLLEKTDPNIKVKAIRHTTAVLGCRYQDLVSKTLWQLAIPYPKIMDLLIKKCDPNQCDKQTGLAALHQIISTKVYSSEEKTAAVKKILENSKKKINPNLQDKKLLFTPLHYAVIHQEIEIAKILVNHKAKKNEKNIFKETPKKILDRLHKNKLIEEKISKTLFQVIN